MTLITRKLFKHGGSQAINLPKEFVENLNTDELLLEFSPNEIIIRKKSELDTIETDPRFATFIQAIGVDAMKHPEKLHDLDDAWKDLDTLLKDVPYEGDDE
ncbi:MAG: AbrB/MazE/SpoVT family DNA-binding domain-containing protein [Candidatus Omnitrophica bacterium]|nr:AbrB/MazE/SpoVT family DNA-binding domain-containing protein [Candidatus Omnitrophota bacterium]